MNFRQVAAALALAVFVTTSVALPAAAAGNGTVSTATDEATETNASDDGPGIGEQMTAFMQSSAAQANDTVEDGMWEAAFEHANESERARMVHNRTDHLEKRLERLRDRNETVHQRYENGTLPRAAYVAQSSQIEGQIQALLSGIDGVADAAANAGVNTTRLQQLETNASQMTGPEAAGIARSLVDGTSAPADGGPIDAPNGTDRGQIDDVPTDAGDEAAPNGSTDGGDGAPTDVADGGPTTAVPNAGTDQAPEQDGGDTSARP